MPEKTTTPQEPTPPPASGGALSTGAESTATAAIPTAVDGTNPGDTGHSEPGGSGCTSRGDSGATSSGTSSSASSSASGGASSSSGAPATTGAATTGTSPLDARTGAGPATKAVAAQVETSPAPWTAGWQAAAATTPPMQPMPKLPPPVPQATPYWERVARPAGVLPAAAITGVIGATVIPIDRPGIGWLLAGTVLTGALCAVDYRARSRASADPTTNTAAAPAPSASPNKPTPPIAGHLSATAGPAGAPPHTTPSNEQSTPTAERTSASDAAEVQAEANQLSSPAPESAQTHRAPSAAGESSIARPDKAADSGSTEPTPTGAAQPSATSATAASQQTTDSQPTVVGSTPAVAQSHRPEAPAVESSNERPDQATGPAPSTPRRDGARPGSAQRTPTSGGTRSGLPHSAAITAAEQAGSANEQPDQTTGAGPAQSAPPRDGARPGSAQRTPTSGGSGLPHSAATTAAGHADSAGAASTSGVAPVGSEQTSSADPRATGRVPSAANAAAGHSESDVERPASTRDRVWWAAAALVLLGVGTFRAAGWLFVLCVLAAGVAGSLGVLGRATRRGLLHDVAAVPVAVFGAVPWAFAGLRPGKAADSSTVRRYGASVAVTAALLVVFVPLLGGADATFAELLSGLVPSVDAATAWQWILLFGVVAAGALGALYLLAGPPAPATAVARPARTWARGEWMLPVGALTVLFAAFVGAQFVALFGGDDYVQRTAGLTYAEYARSGFWQLSAVSVLTLAVILAVLRWAAQDSAADRRWLRILLSAVSVLALVIVGSALARMWTYQQAYGFTVLRLLVEVCELWVGLVYVLVLVAIARLRWSWVPRAAVGTALATLVALALLNPEHLVAERNVDRWEHGKRLDTGYLSRLSPDILPALTGLPPELRLEIEEPIHAELDDDAWWSWNLSRSAAR
ncbi:DUF4153 domain-containing protein [Nocardia asteroides]|uniref:DUF4153 domain-containing protein n=1 Tax=Nocardia asteroides TaxID=1824 RepID=UPI0033F1BBD3